jgi:hypothetical protein
MPMWCRRPWTRRGELAIGVDPVAAHAVMGVGCPVAGSGFRAGCVGGGGGGAVGQGPVRPLAVVEAGEAVEEGLELGEDGWLGSLGGEPGLEGLPEPFDLALGLGGGWAGCSSAVRRAPGTSLRVSTPLGVRTRKERKNITMLAAATRISPAMSSTPGPWPYRPRPGQREVQAIWAASSRSGTS